MSSFDVRKYILTEEPIAIPNQRSLVPIGKKGTKRGTTTRHNGGRAIINLHNPSKFRWSKPATKPTPQTNTGIGIA